MQCWWLGDRKPFFFFFFLMRSASLRAKVGDVCCYYIIWCLMHTLWYPHLALSSSATLPSSTGQVNPVIAPKPLTHSRWALPHLGYLWVFPPEKEKSQGPWLPSPSCPNRSSSAANHSTGRQHWRPCSSMGCSWWRFLALTSLHGSRSRFSFPPFSPASPKSPHLSSASS